MKKKYLESELCIGILLFILFLLNVADGVFTILWVETGIAFESNPTMAFLLQQGPLIFMFAKILGCATVVWLLWKNRISKSKLRYKVILVGGSLIYILINIWHFVIFVSFLVYYVGDI